MDTVADGEFSYLKITMSRGLCRKFRIRLSTGVVQIGARSPDHSLHWLRVCPEIAESVRNGLRTAETSPARAA
jgi:hypothetical protein